MKNCPKCGSGNAEFYKYAGADALKCGDCSYDEGADFEEYPTEKKSQKAKGSYTPYKSGGHARTRK